MIKDSIEPPLSRDLELDVCERLVLTSFRFAMMDSDIAAESSAAKVELKCRDRDAEVMAAIALLRAMPHDAPPWLSSSVTRLTCVAATGFTRRSVRPLNPSAAPSRRVRAR